MQFSDLELSAPILTALQKAGYQNPTPIQEQTIPILLDKKDVLACAQTGTGKTAAFSLPIIELLNRSHRGHSQPGNFPLALVVCPTRELAIQIAENIEVYTQNTKIKHAVIFGGVSQHGQVQELRKKPEILIATPGRLLDLIQQQIIHLNAVKYLVLDEADRMLDMGFVHDIKRIIKLLPERRQTMLFSATMPESIRGLANSILYKPEYVAVTPVSSTVDTISQAVFPVEKLQKVALLEQLIKKETIDNILVFSRTKHGSDKIVRKLRKAGITSEAIHGNKSQNARQNALKGFKSGHIKVLVATDIAARGIDIDALQLVINFDLPNEAETYVHRIGRTGRAGASGRAWSFCSEDEIEYLWDIQKLISQEIPLVTDHDFIPRHLDAYKQAPQKGSSKSSASQKKAGTGQRNQKRSRSRNYNRSGR